MQWLAATAANGPSPRAWGLLRHITLLGHRTGPSPRAWGLLSLLGGRDGHDGPSPRAWGLRGLHEHVQVDTRAIPTCVGTTSSGTPSFTKTSGHPHVRGDYCSSSASRSSRVGPSPRAWGLRFHQGRPGAWGRAIPTCVGTTPPRPHPPHRPAGHPHVRGDYRMPLGRPLKPAGPSPRAWGLLPGGGAR